jgi:hypothetical protein
MTYLELVNAVLRKLRETEATTVDETDYTRLIGDFVNDAKRLVEDSWDWSSLRTTETISTVAGTNLYSLTDFGVRSEVFQVFNETDQTVLSKKPLQEIRKLDMLTNTDTNEPINYALSGTDANGDIQIRLFPTPDSTVSVSVYGIKRTADLTNDADTVSIPSHLIVNWAYSYALVERGETGGQSGAEQAFFANRAMSDAIALDAGMHSDELVWTTV